MGEDMQTVLLNQLKARFDSLKGAYQRLDDIANRDIVRWRHALESAFEIRVDYFRRTNNRPAALIDDEPDANSFYAYGYDAQGRVIYAAIFGLGDLPMTSIFYTYRPDGIEIATYHSDTLFQKYTLIKVARLVQPSGQNPTHYAEYAVAGHQEAHLTELYHYDEAGRLAKIEVSQGDGPIKSDSADALLQQLMEQQRTLAQMFGREDLSQQMEGALQNLLSESSLTLHEEFYEYQGEALQRIVHYTRESTFPIFEKNKGITLYQAPRAGETPEALFAAGRVSLRQAILDALAKFDQRATMKICWLVLEYDVAEDDGLMLTFGADEVRQAWEQATPKSSPNWNFEKLYWHVLNKGPATRLKLSDIPNDYDRCLRAYQQAERYEEVDRLMRQVAQDLNAHNWQGLLNVTDDFIVFAHDYEAMGDIRDDLRACVPDAKLHVWREKGLVA